MVEINGRYITYKSMIAGMGTTIGIVVVLLIFAYQSVTNKIDQRVSLELYKSETSRLCADVEKIHSTVEANAKQLTEVAIHQKLVLQKLGIPYSIGK
jgi:Na+-transporting methylmalonyl-CoA/oxaloacetate decarboxylase gamma subunit